jgi:hypothetical protein
MFFTVPEDARWNAERQAVKLGRDRRVAWRGPGPAAGFPAPTAGAPTPKQCVEAFYLQRTRFESIAERKLARRLSLGAPKP